MSTGLELKFKKFQELWNAACMRGSHPEDIEHSTVVYLPQISARVVAIDSPAHTLFMLQIPAVNGKWDALELVKDYDPGGIPDSVKNWLRLSYADLLEKIGRNNITLTKVVEDKDGSMKFYKEELKDANDNFETIETYLNDDEIINNE